MSDTRMIVVRPGTDLPEGFMPEHWDGRWIEVPVATSFTTMHREPVEGYFATAVATGRHETRDDGVRAEVFEVQVP